MSILFPFRNQVKPRRFDHKPIYYDKQKEERRERYDRLRQEMQGEDSNPAARNFEDDIRGSFRQNVPGGSVREKAMRFNRIVFIVSLILFGVVMLIYFLN